MNRTDRINYLEKKIEKLEHVLRQLRTGRRVLMTLLEKSQEERVRLQGELSQSSCFRCSYRQRTPMRQKPNSN